MIKVEFKGPGGSSFSADVMDHDAMTRWIWDASRLIRVSKVPTTYTITVQGS